MFKTQKNKLKLTKGEYKFWQDMCRKSKNLYNTTLYETNQHFDNCGGFLNYNSAYHVMKDKSAFKSFPTDPGGQTMKVVERCFRSFFGVLKKKGQGNYNKPIQKPKYLPKNGYFLCIFPQRNYQCKEYFVIQVPKDLQDKYKFKKFTYPIPPNVQGNKIKEVRILPKCNATYFEIEFVYEVEPEPKELNKERILSIDPGVNNFATCLNSETGRSFILDGREMKSINQWYNKKLEKLHKIYSKQGKKKSGKRVNQASQKRERQIQEFLNQYVNFIAQICLYYKIGQVVIGEGWLAQNESNIGKVNNQNFVNLPFGKFAWKLKAKLEFYGIKFATQAEPYTSKCDHLAHETMHHHDKYLGKRDPRGLFKSSIGKVLNSDVNGALGIMIKFNESKGNILRNKLISGVINTPCRIRLNDIQQTSAMRLVKVIFN